MIKSRCNLTLPAKLLQYTPSGIHGGCCLGSQGYTAGFDLARASVACFNIGARHIAISSQVYWADAHIAHRLLLFLHANDAALSAIRSRAQVSV